MTGIIVGLGLIAQLGIIGLVVWARPRFNTRLGWGGLLAAFSLMFLRRITGILDEIGVDLFVLNLLDNTSAADEFIRWSRLLRFDDSLLPSLISILLFASISLHLIKIIHFRNARKN